MTPRRPLNIFIPHCSDFLTDHIGHGDGLVAHGFILRLAERGHVLHVAVSQSDLQSPLPPNVHLYTQSARSHGIRSRLRYIRQMRALFRRLSRQITFDVVHQLNPVYTGISLGLAGCRAPVVLGPYIAEWPDAVRASGAHRGLARVVTRVLRGAVESVVTAAQQRFASVLLLTTPVAADRLADPGAFSKVVTLPHGVDTALFCPQPGGDEKSHPDVVQILFMAQVNARKGIFDLLQAFEQVALRCPQARLAVAGDGVGVAEAEAIAAASLAWDRIRFLGVQSRAGAAAVLQSCDIYCLPSHGEPYGMTAVEAMSCGKPLVVTDAGGLASLVDDEGGLRVPVGAPQALADAICTLIAQPARRRAMGDHNRRRVLDSMAWDRVIDRLEQIYFAAIAGKRQGQAGAALCAPSSEDYA